MENELILIADGNPARGKRVATALEAAGHPCRVAPHGAAALEIALAERPSLVISQAELPLVEADKLSEILRANPRTRSARFLFLGVEPHQAAALGGVGDETLPREAETNDIQDRVELLLERQARIRALEERAGAERELEGALDTLGPAELLQMLHGRRSSGRLTLTPELPDGSTTDGWILIVEGEIHSAQAGPVEAEKALFRMLDWHSGVFRFEPAEIEEDLQGEGKAGIKAPTRAVLAEGLRQLDEWNRLAPMLPPMESPVKLRVAREALPQVVHPVTREVLACLETADRVADVVDHCRHPDYQVLRTLHTLAEREIIEFGRARIAPEETSSHALFNEAQCRRLRAFAREGLVRQAPPPDVKLLVVTSSREIVDRFGGLLAKVPGAERAPRFVRGEVADDDLELLARIDVDGDFGIDLVHLPTAEAFEPLWRFAGHRALGTIFLLDARMGLSAAGLGPIAETLSQPDGARTFHVVLLGDGERLSPDELRANLSLIDEASLFLLPIEEGKDPGSLLRILFARIVP